MGANRQKRYQDLSFWDAIIALNMARIIDPTLTQTDPGPDHVNKERSPLLDRIEGSAKSITVIQNPDGTPVAPMAILTPADGAQTIRT